MGGKREFGACAQVTFRVTIIIPDLDSTRTASRGKFGVRPRYQHFTAFGLSLFSRFTLRNPGFRNGMGLFLGGEPNHISWGDLHPGLADVDVRFIASHAQWACSAHILSPRGKSSDGYITDACILAARLADSIIPIWRSATSLYSGVSLVVNSCRIFSLRHRDPNYPS